MKAFAPYAAMFTGPAWFDRQALCDSCRWGGMTEWAAILIAVLISLVFWGLARSLVRH